MRSIPAHAGEPTLSAAQSGLVAVYPRPRGGTARMIDDAPFAEGLSPPTRGNHHA